MTRGGKEQLIGTEISEIGAMLKRRMNGKIA
jgi:hypothetical protein